MSIANWDEGALDTFIRNTIDGSDVAALLRDLFAGAGWITPTLSSGFTNYASFAYARVGTLIVFQGEIQCNPAPVAGATIFTLPVTYRPSYRSRWIIVGNSGGLREAGVNGNGDVVTGDFGTPTWTNNEVLNLSAVQFAIG
jgi:hypothetical protein